jgi:hypothetical protein
MNECIKFLAQQRTSYLAGKAIEAILDGDHAHAQNLLSMEIESMKSMPPQKIDQKIADPIGMRIDCINLDDSAKVCFGCIKKDMPHLPKTYQFTSVDKGQCESCGHHDLHLTTLLKVRSFADQVASPLLDEQAPSMLQAPNS